MQIVSKIILWLAFIFGCFLPAAALTPTATENRVWEIFSIGYDATSTEATDLESRTETSTSNYDTAPIHHATSEAKPIEANRSLFGSNAEFKAAEVTATDISAINRGFGGTTALTGDVETVIANMAYYQGLSGPARQQAFQDFRDYTQAFDAKYGTSLWDAAVREGVPKQ